MPALLGFREVWDGRCAGWLKWERDLPNNYTVLNSGSVVVEFWAGQVTHDELLAHERGHLSAPLIKAGVFVLIEIEKFQEPVLFVAEGRYRCDDWRKVERPCSRVR